MEAQQVINKILSEAQVEADRIKSEAREKQTAEQAQLDKHLGEYKTKTNELTEKTTQDKKAHMLASARMDIAKKYLTEKRKLMQEVFDRAKEQLVNMPDDQYRQLMKKLMVAAVETGDEEVLVDVNEKRIDHEFIKQVNRELGPGFHGNLRLSEEREAIGGGFVLRRGRIRNNVSLAVLLEQAKKELEIDLARELFSDSG